MSASSEAPSEARNNLKHVTPYVLTPGEMLFRLASTSANFGYMASDWWLREPGFQLLIERAKKSKFQIGAQARLDLSILESWGSKLDVYVRATVRQQLEAWMGPPQTQRETARNGMVIVLPGCQEMQQVFIPGIINEARMLTPYGRAALSVEHTAPLYAAALEGLGSCFSLHTLCFLHLGSRPFQIPE